MIFLQWFSNIISISLFLMLFSFYVIVVTTRMARICIEECIRYAMTRETFGKKLYHHQAIRMKIAAMIRRVEALQAWYESLVYQMCTMTHEEANLKLGDVISLAKAECSKVYEYCARETTQIFGGNALYMDGVGKKIEVAVGQVKGYQIPAGAEDIMDDFAARTAFKFAKQFAKL
jgi:alkylation response protein AidB-like acyl-CoA dehydrogenase